MSAMDLQILLASDRPFYTARDDIAGKVIFRAQKDMKVKSIYITFHGASVSSDYDFERDLNGHRLTPDIVRKVERHVLQQGAQILFPPQELIDNTNEKTIFKIVKGTHEYPFKFKVKETPLCSDPNYEQPSLLAELSRGDKHMRHPYSPPSCTKMDGNKTKGILCFYELRAHVKRAGFMSTDLSMKRQVQYYPIALDPSHALEISSRRRMVESNVVSTNDLQVSFGFFTPSNLVQGMLLPFNLCLLTRVLPRPNTQLKISALDVRLEQQLKVRAKTFYTCYKSPIVLVDKETFEEKEVDISYAQPVPNADFVQYSTDITHLIAKDLKIPDSLPPTFTFCNWMCSYVLHVKLEIKDGAETHTLEFTQDTKLLPPVDYFARQRRFSAAEREIMTVFGVQEDDHLRMMGHVVDDDEQLPSYSQATADAPVFV